MSKIVVSNLGKAYKQYFSRWGRLVEWMLPCAKPRHTLKWVLQDISFEVSAGEAVGIIGINGAGKSTLLKMITGTTRATTGSVTTQGRVAAMLELGMGFHPDFTGRQNAYMAGQLLGYSMEDVTQLMPQIEAFAEIGSYIDQPVRVYSSGMQMRLAFSVATARRPDILIVDEALSVGDAYFRHKSFDRIRAYGREGTTLLIVSHDKQAIQSICDRAILLNGGSLAMQGDPEAVMDFYNALLADRKGSNISRNINSSGDVETRSGTEEVVISSVSLLNDSNDLLGVVGVGASVRLRVSVSVNKAVPDVVIGYSIKDRLGQTVFGTNTFYLDCAIKDAHPGDRITVEFQFPMNIGPGTYSVSVAVHATESHVGGNYEWRDLAMMFSVVNPNKSEFVGIAWLPPVVRICHE